MRAKGLQFPDYAKNRHYLTRFFTVNPKIKEEVHKAVDIQNQSYKMNIDEVELLDEYKEKLLAMRIEIIKFESRKSKVRIRVRFFAKTTGRCE